MLYRNLATCTVPRRNKELVVKADCTSVFCDIPLGNFTMDELKELKPVHRYKTLQKYIYGVSWFNVENTMMNKPEARFENDLSVSVTCYAYPFSLTAYSHGINISLKYWLGETLKCRAGYWDRICPR